MRLSLAVGVLVVVLSAALGAQSQSDQLMGLAAAKAQISIELLSIPLRDAIVDVAERVKVKVLFADDLPSEQLDKRVDAVFRNAVFHDMMTFMLDKSDLSATVVDRWTMLIDRKTPQN